ncbi:MAG TPA: hypothetical protein VEC39_05955 [Vicinamibacterales bacterium]|nr:hypothetical protein [Vicinamibacterales bacterium]
MQRSTKTTAIVGALALTAMLASLTATTLTQGGQAPPPANTPPKPLVPVAASSVAANPDPYIGEFVTMTGAVEANLSKTSFSVDQDKSKATGKEVLVLAPSLQQPAEQNGYVTVIGELIKFDEKEVAAKLKDYKIDLSPADVQKYAGKPVVLATAVINNSGIDIAKKPIPPMTADDLALQKIMTRLPPAQGAVRKALDSKDVAASKEQATILKTAFTEIEAFFKAKNNAEALKWATEGKNHAEAILVNLGLNNVEAAKTSIAPLGATCASCHGKYRERMEDGTFRYKPGF